MTTSEYVDLLRQARVTLERYLFDGDEIRDDVANMCAKLDDVLLDPELAALSQRSEAIGQAA
jgi:hypothetical protein